MKTSQWLTIVGSAVALVAWFYVFKIQGLVLMGLIALVIGGFISILRQKSWIFKTLGMVMFIAGLFLLLTYPWLLYRRLF